MAIVTAVVVVALVVVLAGFWAAGAFNSSMGPPPPRNIVSAFFFGISEVGGCSAGYTYATKGCTGGDFGYTVTVYSTSVSFGNVMFEVKTAAGAIYTAASAGGFSLLNASGTVVAQMTPESTTLAMNSTFETYSSTAGACNGANCGPSTPFTSRYTIQVDAGIGTPAVGQRIVVLGTDGYTGNESFPLP
jgi:hypothetical protein